MSVQSQPSNTVSSVITAVRERELLALTTLLLTFPILTGNWSLSTYVLIYGLFAVVYNLCLGEAGMLTFGHAAFFGLGAYGAGVVIVNLNVPPTLVWVGLLFGVLIAAIGGLIIGGLALQREGTYLALITLGFAQLLWFVAFQWRSVTGGDDGLVGVHKPAIGLPGAPIYEFRSEIAFYALALVIFLGSMFIIQRIRNSHFGKTLNAIRENENRAEFLGYDTHRYKLATFIISAAFSGLAGALYPLFLTIVGLKTLHWQLSGEVNFFVLLGGVGTLTGPVLGAGAYLLIRDSISAWVSFWQLPVGLLLIALVLYFPEGLLGTAKDRLESGDSSGKPGHGEQFEEVAD